MPDIVLPSRRAIVEVRGCFWHQHPGCRSASILRTRQDYWVPKLARNIERDTLNEARLREQGWRVIVIWECETRTRCGSSNCQTNSGASNQIGDDGVPVGKR
jgi:DNA mismatch endonuclease, patch repair protein